MCVNACFDRLAYLSISIAWRQSDLQPILHIASDAGSVTGVGVFLRMSETIAEVFEAGEI